MILLQILFNALVTGSIYALVASGFSIIYSTNKFMHFAHGTTVALSAYFMYFMYAVLRFQFWAACIITIILTIVVGIGTFKVIYEPLQKRNSSNIILLIASLGVLILIENLIMAIFGTYIKTLNYIEAPTIISIFGATITLLQIITIVITIFLFVILHLLMYKTKLGKQLRAVADTKELAQITGINEKKIAVYSFGLGSILAAIAGILISVEQAIMPTMGTQLIVKGFTGSIIGGINSIPGSILGSYILGLAENIGIWFLPSGYKEAIAFVLLFIFLLVKPQGLFGVNKGARK